MAVNGEGEKYIVQQREEQRRINKKAKETGMKGRRRDETAVTFPGLITQRY